MKYLLILLTLTSLSAHSGDTSGNVGRIYIHNVNSKVVFRMTSTAPGFNSCATTNRYAIDTDTQAGKNILSTLLATKVASQTIFVKGSDTCNLQSGAEDVNYIYVD